jgi:hypothetical protein
MSVDKKISQCKARISGNSRSSFLSNRRNAVRELVILVIICAVIADVFSVKFIPCSYGQPWRLEEPSDHAEDPVQLPVIKPLSTKQEVIALKNEELELAEQLMRDFPGREESLVVMGNL